ncbi:MAG: DUF2339 domain-containing protein [Verrucomicrobiota bacterium]
MNEHERQEWEQLKQLIEAQQVQLNALRARIDALSTVPAALVTNTTPASSQSTEPTKVPSPAPVAVPPLLVSPEVRHSLPPPLPKYVPPPIQPLPECHPTEVALPAIATNNIENIKQRRAAALEQLRSHRETTAEVSPLAQEIPNEPATAEALPAQAESVPKGSLEMRLGTYWFVRVGIVMVLTALVWAGYYAYDKFHLGGPGKVIALYVFSGLLMGAGAWLQRQKEKISVRNFGEVVFAGGLAAVYFTTYAAHHVASLRVISSPFADGVLLLAWAGFMIWLADRKKSEVLAMFATGLAYYTSAITSIGLFTLFSNLVLTSAAVFFLLRNRWVGLSVGSLVATYGGFAFWRFYNDGWDWNQHADELTVGNVFLGGYWLVFTAAGFLSKAEKLMQTERASFLSANNGAFFGLVVLSMWHADQGTFWRFAMSCGAVLIGLALAARRYLTEEKVVRNAYLTQGIALVTLGLITKFSGHTLALLLATESVILLILGNLLANRVLRVGAQLCALLAVGWGLASTDTHANQSLIANLLLGAMLVFNAWWNRRRNAETETQEFDLCQAYFSALGLLMWAVTTWQFTPNDWLVPTLAVEALLLTLSYYVLRVREITAFGQCFLLLGVFTWLGHKLDAKETVPWWNPAILIAVLVAISHWWQRQQTLTLSVSARQGPPGLYALATVGILFFWLQPEFAPSSWMAFTCLLALVLTGYGLLTRAWFLAAFGQLFLLVSAVEFLRQLDSSSTHPAWYFALAPMATLLSLAAAALYWYAQHPDLQDKTRTQILTVGIIYRWAALPLGLLWIFDYIPAQEQVWVLALVGVALFALSGWRQSREALLACGVMLAVASITLIAAPARPTTFIYWPNLATILVFPVLQQLARRQPARFPLPDNYHAALMIPGALLLWFYLSRWVMLATGGRFYVTATWAGLALGIFGAGFLLRERIYRWLGLSILLCALARVILYDVWQLAVPYRILSFLALGFVLLVLGYLYNKYQEKIREWL